MWSNRIIEKLNSVITTSTEPTPTQPLIKHSTMRRLPLRSGRFVLHSQNCKEQEENSKEPHSTSPPLYLSAKLQHQGVVRRFASRAAELDGTCHHKKEWRVSLLLLYSTRCQSLQVIFLLPPIHINWRCFSTYQGWYICSWWPIHLAGRQTS